MAYLDDDGGAEFRVLAPFYYCNWQDCGTKVEIQTAPMGRGLDIAEPSLHRGFARIKEPIALVNNNKHSANPQAQGNLFHGSQVQKRKCKLACSGARYVSFFMSQTTIHRYKLPITPHQKRSLLGYGQRPLFPSCFATSAKPKSYIILPS